LIAVACGREVMKRASLRGQSDLIGVVVLLGAVLVIGVAFAGMTLTNVSTFVSVNRVKTALSEDQSSVFIYVERENTTHTCLGVLRIVPDYRVYAIGLFTSDLSQDLSSAIVPPKPDTLVPRTIESNRVYRLYQGEYYPIPVKGLINVYFLTDQAIRDYILQRKPLLVCVDKSGLPSDGYLVVFSFINNELYEVRGWYVKP
jgi:hypothetical protein